MPIDAAIHPLIALAHDRRVITRTYFGATSAELTVAELAVAYDREWSQAPQRTSRAKPYS